MIQEYYIYDDETMAEDRQTGTVIPVSDLRNRKFVNVGINADRSYWDEENRIAKDLIIVLELEEEE